MVVIPKPIEDMCARGGIKLTAPRRVILGEIISATDHPDIDTIYQRIKAKNHEIGIATIYRTIALLEEAQIISKLELHDGKARYEIHDTDHHDHFINMETGEVIEFNDPELELLQEKIATRLGFKLVKHRMELYGIRITGD